MQPSEPTAHLLNLFDRPWVQFSIVALVFIGLVIGASESGSWRDVLVIVFGYLCFPLLLGVITFVIALSRKGK